MTIVAGIDCSHLSLCPGNLICRVSFAEIRPSGAFRTFPLFGSAAVPGYRGGFSPKALPANWY